MLNFKNIIIFLIVLIFDGCGTGIGNFFGDDPDNTPANEANEPTISDENFNVVIEEYNNLSSAKTDALQGDSSAQNEGTSLKYDCGKITDSTPEEEKQNIRACFYNSFKACDESIILLDITTTNGRLVSFGQIKSDCSIYIHTVGNDSSIFNNDISNTCTTLSSDDNFEYACGIKS